MTEPTWFGKYRLANRVATGGMAEVYVGRRVQEDGSVGPMVAVKRLLPHHAKSAAIVRMFLNEARITSQIRHPNVVTILELGQVGAEPFIAMELLQGKSFEEVRAKAMGEGRRVPMPIWLLILTEACRGLDSAHKAVDENGQPLSLVHRDFTPDNIHVGFNGDVKVIDFGIARTAAWGSGTEPGILKGKFFYMSPEMVLSRPVDHRADLFAAGVMLYEQLCGHRPFTGMTVDEVLKKIARGDPQPPSAFDPAVPKELEAIVMRALAKEPSKRYPSLAELVDALVNCPGVDLATPEGLGKYVLGLFPPGEDEAQRALALAREIDPSHPGVGEPRFNPADFADTSPSARQLAERERREALGPPPDQEAATTLAPSLIPGSSLDPSRAREPTAAQRQGTAPGRVHHPEPSGSPKRVVAVVGLVVLAALVGGAVVLLTATRPAATVMAEATSAKDPTVAAKRALEVAELPDATDAQLKEASALLVSLGDWERALAFSDAWTKRAPDSLPAKVLEGRAATRLRKGKRAEAALRAAETLAPNDPEPSLLRAELRQAQGDPSGMAEALAQALKKAPDDVALAVRVGLAYSQAERLDDAMRTFEGVLKVSKDPLAMAELGFIKLRKEQPAEALRLLQAAVKAKPDLMVAHYYLGTALYPKGDVDGARREYEEADRLAGADTRPLVAWCTLEKQQEDPRLEEVKKRIAQRFPAQAKALIAGCAP